MKYRNRIYNLLINEQSSILELLKVMDVKNPEEKIKNILDEQLFEILECDENNIISIRKKSTGEIFRNGDIFYSLRYNKWIERKIRFDVRLTGSYSGDTFYKNYVNCDSGIYHLNEISTTDKIAEEVIQDDEIVLNGVTYVVKK